MADRHKSKPKAVRMPGSLLAWYEEFAGRSAVAVNAVLVRALEEFRARTDGATTQADGATTSGSTTLESASGGSTAKPRGATARRPRRTVTPAAPGVPPTAFQEPAEPERGAAQCPPHPKGRVTKKFCGACGRPVGDEAVR